MKKVIAVAASLGINVAMFFAFQNSAEEALPVPSGEVTVVDLNTQSAPTLAQATRIDATRFAP